MTFCVYTRRKELMQALPRRFKSQSAILRVNTAMFRGTSGSCGKQVCLASKNMGKNAYMSSRKASGAAVHIRACSILAVAASSSINDHHRSLAEDVGVGGAASMQRAASLKASPFPDPKSQSRGAPFLLQKEPMYYGLCFLCRIIRIFQGAVAPKAINHLSIQPADEPCFKNSCADEALPLLGRVLR